MRRILFFLVVGLFVFLKSSAATALSFSAPADLADIVEKLTPAVVNISTTQTIKESSENLQLKQFPPGSPFEDFNEFFKRFIGPQMGNRKATSLGSGFVIDPDGYIVTNNHVVEKAEEIDVNFGDDTQYKAKVIGTDVKTDLALLKIDAGKKLPYVKFGDSDKSRVGDWVIVIGNPFGLGGTVTTGIISARARDINSGPFDDFIQTDAAINRGNSGGPMFNMDGEVIGINSAIYSPNGVGNVGIGFAVPSSLSDPIIRQLKKSGKVHRGWLGVRIQNVSEEIAESMNLPNTKGALVAEVVEGSPAEEAGIKSGDIILEFNDHEITTMKKLPRIVADTDIGKESKIEVLRDGKMKELSVKVGELEEEEKEEKPSLAAGENKAAGEGEIALGMTLIPLNEDLRKKNNISPNVSGLLVLDTNMAAEAYVRGIGRGDVIVGANQQNLTSTNQFKEILNQAEKDKRKSILLLVNKNGENVFIALPLEKKK